MNATYLFLPFLTVLLLLSSCDEGFEELNANPNEPELVPPSTLFPLAIREAAQRIHGHSTRNERLNLDGGMLWMQYFARNQYVNEGDTYNPAATLRSENWDGFYTESLVNLQTVINLTSDPESEDYNLNYAAAATIMREYVFSIVTDTWGAIPYTNALDGATEGNLAPAYDSQATVYASMLANLKAASEQLDPAGAPIEKDILFGSDMMMWKKFANSLRLRLANRQAKQEPAASAEVFREIMGDPATYPIVTPDEDGLYFQPTVRQSGENNNSWNETMVYGGREDWSISTTLIAAMADNAGEVVDPRLEIYAEPALAGDYAGKYAGAPNGLPEGDAVAYYTTASRPGAYFMGETSAIPLITRSEIDFILAEASLDGDFTGGSAPSEYLQAGVEASFKRYGLTVPDGYLAGLSTDMETIITEKWKALFPQGIEAWTEYRRTGYPVLPQPDPRAVMENEGKVPTRLRYPESEYSLNAANVTAAVGMNGGPDNKLTALWWAE
ncbi:SusD-like starch-binding protein associating with outer membrane [Neolewinella xylanilytica]|uniref:SusD-like starch-binding protein associating with outer membrane n=1 Tax=Neolewinella xylanilytica TaxID=1514080 RepID=A0A2S6I7S4_9BACT|nr:SusD/RagB family nutrient-binding outer membrane lipoprotein [Neolewinella xylanilytica]PPK87553.1 SusD-like starch-binding protein associating with outer membrane [Neolewinella xylanilytica]